MPGWKNIGLLALSLLFGAAAFLLPAYFKAVDPVVIQKAAKQGTPLWEVAERFELAGNSTAAQFLSDSDVAPGSDASAFPFWADLIEEANPTPAVAVEPFLTKTSRAQAIRNLDRSTLPAVRILLPAIPAEPSSASAAEERVQILPERVGGILAVYLAAERSFQPQFLGDLVQSATSDSPADNLLWFQFCEELAVWGNSLPFEVLSQMFRSFDSPMTFLEISNQLRGERRSHQALVSRLLLSDANPEELVRFLKKFPQRGLSDLNQSFAMGPGGSLYQLDQQKVIQEDTFIPSSFEVPGFEAPARLVLLYPEVALILRMAFWVFAFFFLIISITPLLPNPGDRGLARPNLFEGAIRKFVLASIFAGAILLLFEPTLFQQPDSADTTVRFQLQSASLVATSANLMNTISIDDVTLLILLIFLALQLGLYVFCLVKLSEIRRQNVSEETKLKLLDNEENLFDGGLYLGLGGTVASLIFLAVGVVEASLMAAYASTLFGIIFVSLFKIFHLRPLKRKLILSARVSV
ncbi:MAG: hypothetical protein AAGJ81_01705 [Verrucomicrobiota bacterium]